MKAKPKASLKAVGRKASGIKTSGKPAIPGPSSNPMTNLIVADLVLRAGTRVARHAMERVVLGTKYSPSKSKDIVKSRTMMQTLVGTAVARVATGSVPGALAIGGALLAKSLYDRRKNQQAAKVEGEISIEKQARQGKNARDA